MCGIHIRGVGFFYFAVSCIRKQDKGERDAFWEEGNIDHFKLVRHMLVDPKERKKEDVLVELGQNDAPYVKGWYVFS